MNGTLGKRIAERRRAKGLKQDELAEMLGVSPQAVSKWENDVSCPDIMLLPKLAAALDITVDELLCGEDDKRSDVKLVSETERKNFDDMVLRLKARSQDGDNVRINLPFPLLRVMLDAGIKVEGVVVKTGNIEIDWTRIIMLVERGVVGKLLEAESADGDTIEILVE